MLSLPEADLRRLLSQLGIPGAVLVNRGQAYFERADATPVESLCAAARDCVPRLCASFHEDLSSLDEPVRRTCPLGIGVLFAPLGSRVVGCTGVLLPVSCQPRDLPADLSSGLPRKSKKRLKNVLAALPAWKNSSEQMLSDKLDELVDAIDERLQAEEESALQETIFNQKDFVAAFCHEALSPVQEIRATLERAGKRLEADPETLQLVSSATTALDMVRTSLEGMRLLFEQDVSLMPNRFRLTDAWRVVEHWGAVYANQLRDKNLEFILDPGPPWYIAVVPEYFEILVRNLLRNGVKYAFDASRYSEAGKLVVRFDSTHCCLTFVNFGVPIPEEEIQSGSLFKLRQRGQTSGDRGRTGRGLGLFLVKLVADLHEATVDVTSRIRNPGGKNEFAQTEFSVTFPRRRR